MIEYPVRCDTADQGGGIGHPFYVSVFDANDRCIARVMCSDHRGDLNYKDTAATIVDAINAPLSPDTAPDREAIPTLIPQGVEKAIDDFVGDAFKRGHASSWHYGKLWEAIRLSLLSNGGATRTDEGSEK